ncbi:isoprenyl transferase [Myxococcota bacterium]|nr:isoprenyl transferase [Myxococcota bacterium]MBU1380696.1 isoprenyl transferase [Myxococcota bacterium]MBU1495904.1 isoprenyl transferase [Myxococcota bacterium]
MTVPQHVAIIMDGNGRWAQKNGKPRLWGHARGADTVREITTLSRKLGIKALTLYAFSTKNWDRPEEEVSGLMGLLKEYIRKERSTLLDNDIRFRTIGNISKLPEDLITSINELKDASSHCKSMDFCIALNYGARDEIVRAVKKVTSDILDGKITHETIDEKLFDSYLDTACLPPVDLIIRTSGEFRLSDFLLWQGAYSEFYFTETLWPDFREEEFRKALASYSQRERRFGKTSDQIRK